jgi:hypothetical protein
VPDCVENRAIEAIRDVWDSFIVVGFISAGAFESNSIRRARRIPRLAGGGLSIDVFQVLQETAPTPRVIDHVIRREVHKVLSWQRFGCSFSFVLPDFLRGSNLKVVSGVTGNREPRFRGWIHTESSRGRAPSSPGRGARVKADLLFSCRGENGNPDRVQRSGFGF